MADLREQLLKAGLIDEKQARRASHKQRVEKKQVSPEQRQQQAAQTREETRRQSEAEREADRRRNAGLQAEKSERERGLQERQRQAAALSGAYHEGNIARWEGQRSYYFQDGKRVELLGVSDEAARRLSEGTAAIVRPEHGGPGYVLLAGAAARRLAELDPPRVVCHHA